MNPKRRCAPPSAAFAWFVLPSLMIAGLSAQDQPEPEAQPEAEAEQPAEKVHVLPSWMLPAPGGTLDIGMSADDLIAIEEATWRTDQQRRRDVRKLMPELGENRGVTIEPFFMSKYPVTNAQYKVFVEQTGHRFPFHWWKDGEPENFDSKLKEAKEQFKSSPNPPLSFWQRNWKDLPFKIPTDKAGGSETPMDDYPVVYISWEDANAFAAWAGMRLPTEAEWIWAAIGDQKRQYLWGDDNEGYKEVGIERGTRYDRMWEVGHWGKATEGPFGHGDMVLGVWEWTGELGFFPIKDTKTFKSEREKLLKTKLLRDTDDKDSNEVHKHFPEWRGDSVAIKGGMFSSTKTEMRVGIRADLESIQTMSLVGTRVAKGDIPGRDTSESWIKGDYDKSFFGGDREPNIDDQIGIERYELGAEDAIKAYYTISFVPVSFMAQAKSKLDLGKLTLQSVNENKPLVLGTLVTTLPLADPAIEPGIYTLMWRANGMPPGLEKHLKQARKALNVVKEGEQPERGEWDKTLKKFGITDEEAKAGGVDFVRLNPGGLQVPIEQNSYLLRNSQGNYTRVFKAPGGLEAKKNYEGAKITVGEHRDGGERVTIDFGIPRDDKIAARARAKGKPAVYQFKLDLRVAAESAGNDNWRLPTPDKMKPAKGKKK